MTSHLHRTGELGRPDEQRTRARATALRLAVALPLAVTLPLLAGCASSPATEGTTPADAVAPAAESTPAPEGAATDEEAIAAALDAVQLRFDRWSAGDHAGACELISDAAAERIASTAPVEGDDCATILAAVDEHTAAVVAKADADGVEILTPYYWMPESIAIDASLAEADSTSLVYLPNRAITVEDSTAFSDGPAELPGWLEEPAYLKLVDGVWTFILSSER